MPVLGTYWLRTVCANGYSIRQWKKLNAHLKSELSKQLPGDPGRPVISDIQKWIEETVVLSGRAPEPKPLKLEPFRTDLKRDQLEVYTVRLLNEWLPVEVARLLVEECESGLEEDGIPVLTTARALERLLIREHLSRATLEMLLDPQLISPEHAYPLDREILRDVVLWLLGRTEAPAPSTMPATLLYVAPDSHLPRDYKESVRRATLSDRPCSQRILVPIASASILQILDERVQIGSVIITFDGRLWEAESLQSGQEDFVVYRSLGPLRVDYSADHAWFRAPWTELRLQWSGHHRSVDHVCMFGREWHVSKWEIDSEGMWAHFAFHRMLPLTEVFPVSDTNPWRLRPAAIDMAWATLESALTSSLTHKNDTEVEQLRHADLIPVGRKLLALAELARDHRLQTIDAIETQLRGLEFILSAVIPEYGRVPWRILPRVLRQALIRLRQLPDLRQILTRVFEGLPPEVLQEKDSRATFTSPPHAA